MDIKGLSARHFFEGILVVIFLVASYSVLIATTQVSAIFDSKVVEEAKRDFPDETSSKSPSSTPSASQIPQASVSSKPIDSKNSAKDAVQTNGSQSSSDTTLWFITGGIALAAMLLCGLLLVKKMK